MLKSITHKLALRAHRGLNVEEKMNRSITVVPPLSSYAWRSPSTKIQKPSMFQVVISALNVTYDRPRIHTYYEPVHNNQAIYYDWTKVGDDLRNAMLYYGIDGRNEIERGIETAGRDPERAPARAK